MTMTDNRTPAGLEAAPLAEVASWLAEHRLEMDRGELGWLETLAGFDRDQGWAADGQFSCVDWLMWRTKMARATAYEKLRIAHELRRRPLIRQAFAEGRLSYSAVRIISRIEDPDPDVDAALIDLAAAGSVSDLERTVRVYERYQDQDRPPPPIAERRGLRIRPLGDGTATVEIVLEASEAEELVAGLQAFIDLDRPVDESPRGDTPPVGPAPLEEPSGPARRADAFMDLIRCGLAHAGAGHAPGADRYLVHLIQRDEHTTLLDGTPLDAATTGCITCDTSTVTHHVSDQGEPLRLGRKTPDWNTAQRRAITVRDGGHCRFPGCHHRYVDIHHLQHWTQGGPTNIDNGLLICRRHHTLLHTGYGATGDTNHTITFRRPNGTIIDTTTPRG